MSSMQIPGFNAESSLRPAMGKYRVAGNYGRSVSDIGRSAIIAQALGGLFGTKNRGVLASPTGGGVVLPFQCNAQRCQCRGFFDCINLINTELCADWKCITKVDDTVECACQRR
jgi:hypothetical protein